MAAARAGTSVDRFAYFTDAVMAIAMTLLVLEIPRPEGSTFAVQGQTSKAEAASQLWAFLTGQAASFFSYLLAFSTLWVVWRQHHRLADSIRWVTPAAVGWHFPLLLLVGFLPYATTVVGHYPTNPGAALLYGVTLAGLLFCRSMVLSCAYQPDALEPHVSAPEARREVAASWITTTYWAFTLLFVWWTPWILIAWFLTFALYRLAPRILLGPA
jgi:uncharacterized membrane protein